MRKHSLYLVLLLAAALVLSACGAKTFSDPVAYCAAVKTIDAPDARYTGDALPASLVQALIELELVTADAPPAIQQNAVWRCMEGKVWICHFGANLPCQEKADSSDAPTAEMKSFCVANPAADVIPASETGRATVYEWKCNAGAPEIVKQVFNADAQGFISEFWYELPAK